jgi:hypothetical protein
MGVYVYTDPKTGKSIERVRSWRERDEPLEENGVTYTRKFVPGVMLVRGQCQLGYRTPQEGMLENFYRAEQRADATEYYLGGWTKEQVKEIHSRPDRTDDPFADKTDPERKTHKKGKKIISTVNS